MRKFYKELKNVLILGGKSGWLLLGYYVLQIVFARNKSDITSVDTSAIIFAVYALGTGAYSIKDLRKDEFSKRFFYLLLNKTCIKWFVIYTIICGLSAFWSPKFVLSGYRALECFGLMFLNAAVIKNLLKNLNNEGIMLWSVTYAFVMMSISAINYVQSGIVLMLYYMQFPSTIFFYLYFYFAPKKIMKYPMMLIAVFCRSTTGYIGMALGMCSLILGKKKYKAYGFAIGIALIVAIGVMGVDEVLNNTIFASKGGEMMANGQFQFNSEQTSGRSDIWEPAIAKVIASGREWYGMGFVAGETYFVHDVIGGQVIGMHNGFLSAFVGTGIFGLIFFTLFFCGYIHSVFVNKIPKRYKVLLIAVFFAVLMHTMGNPGLGFRVYGTWMPAMFFVMLTQGLYIKTKYMKGYTPPFTVVVRNGKMIVTE